MHSSVFGSRQSCSYEASARIQVPARIGGWGVADTSVQMPLKLAEYAVCDVPRGGAGETDDE